MAKKKKSQKKKFRQPNQAVATKSAKSTKPTKGVDTKVQKHDVAVAAGVATESVKKPVKKSSTPDYSEFSYVVKETKHTLVIIGGIIVVYLVLWYLFTHTGIGPAIYRFIKL